MKKINALALSTITAFALIGCGGGGSSGGSNSSSSNSGTITPTTPIVTTTTTTGTLIDDKVSGVKYVNGTASGFTDANGQFPYTSGTVEFYLGDIKLGSLSSIPTDKNVFIQDILGIDRTDTSNAKVLKIASLLQSLDSNTSTASGVKLAANTTSKKISFIFSANSLSTHPLTATTPPKAETGSHLSAST